MWCSQWTKNPIFTISSKFSPPPG